MSFSNKTAIHSILTVFLLLSQAFPQNGMIEIPLGIEETPSGKDSFFPYLQIQRKKITLALSGGGARGFAQIGILKVFEKYGLPIDGIAGTSIGAVIGGLYASGYTAGEIESIAHQIQWSEIMQDSPQRSQLFIGQKEEKERSLIQLRLKGSSFYFPSGISAGQSLATKLSEIILNAPLSIESNFDNLCIPFRSVTTDLHTGEKIVLNKGSLLDAMRASMAIPLLFTPVQFQNHWLVDGGLVQNLPVSEARSLNGDIVIAIDTSSKLWDEAALNSPWKIADQVTTIMQKKQVDSELESADIQIQPHLEGFSNTDFEQINSLVEAGEKAAEAVIPQLEHLLMTKSQDTTDLQFQIDEVIFHGCIKTNPNHLVSTTSFDLTKKVNRSQIVWVGQSLMQTGFFKTISAFVDTINHKVFFQIQENPNIESIQLLGNHLFSDSLLLSKMKTKAGSLLNHQMGRHDIQALLKPYRNSGYSLAAIDTMTLQKGQLVIHIDEGIVDQIQLTGNKKTRPYVILRELSFSAGDLINTTQIIKGIDNIYSTGFFEDVHFNLSRNNHKYRLTLHLNEHAYTLLRLGLRYDTERRTQGFIELARDNLFGFGWKGSLFGLYGDWNQKIKAHLWSNRLFNTMLTFNLNISAEKRKYPYFQDFQNVGFYNKNRLFGSFSVGQQMRRFGTVSVSFGSEDLDINPIEGQAVPNESYTLTCLSIRSLVDSRDRVPFPNTGKLHILEYESGMEFLGSDIPYFRLYSLMEAYYPFLNFLTFHPRLYWGTADLLTPFGKQFRLGGMDSFLGLPEESLTGKRVFNVSGELRTPIPWPRWLESYLSIRYDLGGIWGKYVKIAPKDFLHGIGAILSIKTPLGPLHIGFGSMSEGYSRFYLSAGYPF
jgi:NTE family protein